MLKFEGCTFSAAGANKNAQVFGLTVEGTEDVEIKNCIFNGTGYSAILNKGAGKLAVIDSKFECNNIKNPIEGGQSLSNGDVTVENCDFTGIPGNNFINFYNVVDGSEHLIKKCKFHGGYGNNIVRLSNKNNSTAIFTIEDCSYEFTGGGTAGEYTAFLMCQDYTNRTGKKQDFSKYVVQINNLTGSNEGKLFYVYEDGEGIISTNDPYVYVDGELVSAPVVEE